MNDQLRTLVRQAVVAVDVITGNEALDDELAKMYIPDCFAEKFAELIVRECIKQAHSVGDLRGTNDDMIYGADTAAVKISKHFGVEE